MRKVVVALAALVALSLAPSAGASGPQLGTIQGGDGITSRDSTLRYVAVSNGSSTVIEAVQQRGGRIARSYSLDGNWGIPVVTLPGRTGGLSHDGRVLVLADATPSNTPLRSQSSFVIVQTDPFRWQQTIHLRGDFAFDALSPDVRTLYLIQHVSTTDLTSYRVRAYDLRTQQLVAGVIAEKQQVGWTMSGYPVARATSADGRWVYTLYQRNGGYPFIHALDSANRSAVCIGLPWPQAQSQDTLLDGSLKLDAGTLTISAGGNPKTRFVLDTRTLTLTKAQRHGTEAILPGAGAAVLAFLVLAGFALRRRLRTDR